MIVKNELSLIEMVTAADFQKKIGHYQNLALVKPVMVNRNGRERVVPPAVADYADASPSWRSSLAFTAKTRPCDRNVLRPSRNAESSASSRQKRCPSNALVLGLLTPSPVIGSARARVLTCMECGPPTESGSGLGPVNHLRRAPARYGPRGRKGIQIFLRTGESLAKDGRSDSNEGLRKIDQARAT